MPNPTFPIHGTKTYHQKARELLPLLIRQAQAGVPVYYSDIGREIGLHERAFGYPLGAIAETINVLSGLWQTDIPPIQALVISKTTDLPGDGVSWFAREAAGYDGMSRREQKEITRRMHQRVFAFSRWSEVLESLGLTPAHGLIPPDVDSQLLRRPRSNFGESPEHLRLKSLVAGNPSIVGLEDVLGPGILEYCFESSDCVDILFQSDEKWIGVEVKSELSDKVDLVRGLFQCVKYRALMQASTRVARIERDIDVILAVGRDFPQSLRELQGALAVKVVDNLSAGESGGDVA